MEFSKMIRVGIVHGAQAFYPELAAYRDFLTADSDFVVRDYESLKEADPNSDVILLFCGLFPFWKASRSKVIAEYHSLSTGRLPVLKNLLKRLLNIRGDHYLFLNEKVREHLFFSPTVSHDVRGMGFHKALVEKNLNARKIFDFVYSGSTNRAGVHDAILKIASMGCTVAVVGNSEKDTLQFKGPWSRNVELFGRVDIDRSYEIMASARYGINYTIDKYPYYLQDSTKVIEYCALGLGVVTNRYEWVDHFERRVGGKFLSFEGLSSKAAVDGFDFRAGDVDQYSWDSVLRASNIKETVRRLSHRP
ncbi:hypothetical protein QTH90_01780 [Variovorax sp. J2P1-59]|uniref:hypothetical protein n=1 Tax=Variovorax flavidus TaxID=3053501 RepID=UPI002574E86A|nr:hypothetical protein [Variovorax sp. J2P1-59]MDM0073092.1 hypothetical protein [Variovorax sp. J2P1-59]